MQFDPDVLPRMADFNYFKATFDNYAVETAHKALLHPKMSLSRLHDVHFCWRDDLSRITEREPKLKDGPDHFKQCAHLAYWLRRRSPVVEYEDLHKKYEGDGHIYDNERKLRDILDPYGGEYLSFNFGFEICQHYELNKECRAHKDLKIAITDEYIIDACHMLKFKNVSPHSIYMIYRTLFLGSKG